MQLAMLGWIALVALVFSCSKSSEMSENRRSSIKMLKSPKRPLDKVTTEPTNPDGGLVAGRVPDISYEESLQRKMRNEVMPIEFGVGAGGITMATTYDEAHDRLAKSVGTFNGLEFFPEDIRIEWTSQEPQTPAFFIVGPGYKGKVNLGETLGMVGMQTSFETFLDSTATEPIRTLLKKIGGVFEGNTAATYDCEQAFTCRLDENDTYMILEYKRGVLLLSKAEKLSLDIMYFIAPRELRPFLLDPLVYNQSIGGITLASTKADTEVRIGAPLSVNPQNGVHVYDNFNLLVIWNAMNTPSFIMARSDYKGKFTLPGITPATRGLGDSFADLAPDDTDGSKLMQALHRLFENPAEDCIALETCAMIPGEEGLEIQLARGFFGFSNDPSRKLLYFGMGS
ncbi:hypothetical protein [Oligoflexus tunisiensis]|uniref:hypothetical protein n=1 Tax=Oligoflexus tunisiensis TaxID=708132 RepID=UPI00114CFF2C|nr:hypothetical protein [Oligoflexus tunisiensis]